LTGRDSLSQREIGEQFGITQTQVSSIVLGNSWGFLGLKPYPLSLGRKTGGNYDRS